MGSPPCILSPYSAIASTDYLFGTGGSNTTQAQLCDVGSTPEVPDLALGIQFLAVDIPRSVDVHCCRSYYDTGGGMHKRSPDMLRRGTPRGRAQSRVLSWKPWH